jgi:NAD(P)-dependent dehydrogenase (short-subunit alcohol dehydrogenase family)
MSKIAVVTGSSSGLGALIAAALAAVGYEVHGVDSRNGTDATEPEGLAQLSAPVPEIDQLDVLVNCAGINKISWLEDMTEELFWQTMDVNAAAIWKMTKHYLPSLKDGGTVLNIVSNASHMPMRGSLAYNASKGAAHIITLQMARELLPRHGITVFGISPNKLAGTAMSDDIDRQVCEQRGWTMEKAREYQLAGLATGRETDPAVLAEFIGFLLSNKQRHEFLHGCILPYGA